MIIVINNMSEHTQKIFKEGLTLVGVLCPLRLRVKSGVYCEE